MNVQDAQELYGDPGEMIEMIQTAKKRLQRKNGDPVNELEDGASWDAKVQKYRVLKHK